MAPERAGQDNSGPREGGRAANREEVHNGSLQQVALPERQRTLDASPSASRTPIRTKADNAASPGQPRAVGDLEFVSPNHNYQGIRWVPAFERRDSSASEDGSHGANAREDAREDAEVMYPKIRQSVAGRERDMQSQMLLVQRDLEVEKQRNAMLQQQLDHARRDVESGNQRESQLVLQLEALRMEVQKMHATNTSILQTQASSERHLKEQKDSLLKQMEEEAEARQNLATQELEKKERILDKLRAVISRLQEENR
jgi:hypothetical protein